MLTKFLLLAVLTYLAIALAMFFGQRRLIYVPDGSPRVAPADTGLSDVIERVISSDEEGEALAWYAKATPGQPTLLYFHGNGGSLSSRAERIRKYQAKGRGILMMSYRGYSGARGSPSEAANIADGKRAYDSLVADGVAPRDIVVYGESLGSGVAIEVAAEKQTAGLILDAPFTALGDVAQHHYSWLPARHMLLDRYDNIGAIARVKVPLLVVHGALDATTPAAMGRAVYDKANKPKELAIIPGAGHADHNMFGSYDVINAWIDKLRGAVR